MPRPVRWCPVVSLVRRSWRVLRQILLDYGIVVLSGQGSMTCSRDFANVEMPCVGETARDCQDLVSGWLPISLIKPLPKRTAVCDIDLPKCASETDAITMGQLSCSHPGFARGAKTPQATIW
jgi:hypothetical protein